MPSELNQNKPEPARIDADHVSIPYSGERIYSRQKIARELERLRGEKAAVEAEIAEYESYLKVMDTK